MLTYNRASVTISCEYFDTLFLMCRQMELRLNIGDGEELNEKWLDRLDLTMEQGQLLQKMIQGFSASRYIAGLSLTNEEGGTL